MCYQVAFFRRKSLGHVPLLLIFTKTLLKHHINYKTPFKHLDFLIILRYTLHK